MSNITITVTKEEAQLILDGLEQKIHLLKTAAKSCKASLRHAREITTLDSILNYLAADSIRVDGNLIRALDLSSTIKKSLTDG